MPACRAKTSPIKTLSEETPLHIEIKKNIYIASPPSPLRPATCYHDVLLCYMYIIFLLFLILRDVAGGQT